MDEISKLFLRLRQSKAGLEKAFYGSLDSSLIRSAILGGSAFRTWQKLGEGRHFRCLRLTQPDRLDLAINLAKPSFLRAEKRLRKQWAADLQQLRGLDHPLIPPMEVLDDSEFFAYIQPCCDQELTISSEIRQLLEDMQRAMNSRGLELEDYPQLRTCQGHPFVIDFSELNRLQKSGFRL
jgi:hypothetical protein